MLSLDNYFDDLIGTIKKLRLSDVVSTVNDISYLIEESITEKHGKVLLCGNGGSAADCQHFAAELINSMNKSLKLGAIPALALTTDSSVLTSIGNDRNFEEIFSRQIEAFGKKGDILIAFSTSGKSRNVIRALQEAKKNELCTVAFCGEKTDSLKSFADYIVAVPSSNTQHIQEVHVMIYHYICMVVEGKIYKNRENN